MARYKRVPFPRETGTVTPKYFDTKTMDAGASVSKRVNRKNVTGYQ